MVGSVGLEKSAETVVTTGDISGATVSGGEAVTKDVVSGGTSSVGVNLEKPEAGYSDVVSTSGAAVVGNGLAGLT